MLRSTSRCVQVFIKTLHIESNVTFYLSKNVTTLRAGLEDAETLAEALIYGMARILIIDPSDSDRREKKCPTNVFFSDIGRKT